MSIRIVEDLPEVVLTRSEYDRLHREWRSTQSYTTHPQDFESWVRGRSATSTVFGSPPWNGTAISIASMPAAFQNEIRRGLEDGSLEIQG